MNKIWWILVIGGLLVSSFNMGIGGLNLAQGQYILGVIDIVLGIFLIPWLCWTMWSSRPWK